MKKETVSLMCENLKDSRDRINEMVDKDPEEAIRFLHGQYLEAQKYLKDRFQS